jgi:hypothetical protein
MLDSDLRVFLMFVSSFSGSSAENPAFASPPMKAFHAVAMPHQVIALKASCPDERRRAIGKQLMVR